MKNWFRKIVSTLVKWFEPRHKIEQVEEAPTILHDRTIYLVGNIDEPWVIAFKCPCGCNSIIHLNLLEDAEPRWKYSLTSKKRVTISPSIWRTKGCKSHFFIRKSRVNWVWANQRDFG